jgi:hypothetical protein
LEIEVRGLVFVEIADATAIIKVMADTWFRIETNLGHNMILHT